MTHIYHLVPQSYHQQQPADKPYIPAGFAEEGFIHCTAQIDVLLSVANRYFAALTEPLLVYVIDEAQLSSPIKYEAPITPEGQTQNAPDTETIRFPHIYGPLNQTAIEDVSALTRLENGQWTWPD